jgi:alpha-tubulin suppressor-like RCC1 family protein
LDEYIVQVAGGEFHSLALRSDGTVWSWGDNSEGELGDSTRPSGATPAQVPRLTGITQIAAGTGGRHSLALRSDGTVWAWGTTTSVSWATAAPRHLTNPYRWSA